MYLQLPLGQWSTVESQFKKARFKKESRFKKDFLRPNIRFKKEKFPKILKK